MAGNWTYLYRAVDSAGDTTDFMLSPKRDLRAAKLFLRLALSGTGGIRPRGISVEGHPAYARAIAVDGYEAMHVSGKAKCAGWPRAIVGQSQFIHTLSGIAA